MNKLRAKGVCIFAVGVVVALSTAFQWDEIIAYGLVFILTLVYLGVTERGDKPASQRSCLVILFQMVALPVALAIAAVSLVWLGQQFGIPFTQLIYLISGLVCLVGLALFIWSFRALPDREVQRTQKV